MSSDKPRLDRKVLEQHGVIYSEDVYSPSTRTGARNSDTAFSLPDHVESLREALLDFGTPIPETMKPFFENECEVLRVVAADENVASNNIPPPESAYFPIPNPPTRAKAKEMEVAENDIEENQKVAERSRELTAANASEAAWEHTLHSHVFKSFRDTVVSRKKHE
jgi:hypothetical protein